MIKEPVFFQKSCHPTGCIFSVIFEACHVENKSTVFLSTIVTVKFLLNAAVFKAYVVNYLVASKLAVLEEKK